VVWANPDAPSRIVRTSSVNALAVAVTLANFAIIHSPPITGRKWRTAALGMKRRETPLVKVPLVDSSQEGVGLGCGGITLYYQL
jgi:hypothetical protein